MKSFLFNQFLKFRFRQIVQDQKNPAVAQQRAFERLQKKLDGTEIGKSLKISEFRSYKSFVKSIPPRSYDQMKSAINAQIQDPQAKTISKEKVKFIGLSSGTTAEKKQIPYTPSLIEIFNSFQLSVAAILHHDFGIQPLKSKRLSWGTTPVLDTHETGIERGYISGFLSINAPKITRPLSYPQEKVSRIPDMKLKAAAAIEEVQNQDIEFLTGVPSYILGLVEDFQQMKPELNFQKQWPNCRVLAYSAMGIEPFKNRFQTIFGQDFRFLGTYITTEGPFGYQIPSLSESNYFLNYSDILFSFYNSETDEIKTIDELVPGEEVEILTSMPNGMIQYSLGDMLKVKSISPWVEFEVCGRKGQALNLTTEKTTQCQLNQAFAILQNKYNLDVDHFFLTPGPTNGRPFYKWYLTSRTAESLRLLPKGTLERAVDLALAEVSEQYEENRFTLSLLDPPEVVVIPHAPLQNFFTEKSSQGQLKIKSIFDGTQSLTDYLQPIYGQI